MYKGLDLDSLKSQIGEGKISDARNLVFGKKGYTYSLEEGLKELGFTSAKKIHGVVTVEKDIIVFLYDQDSGVKNGEIALIRNNQIYTVIDNAALDFDINYPISGVAKRNFKGETLVAFFNTNSTPKIVNVDYYINTTEAFNINDIEMFPEQSFPLVTQTLSTGGVLNTGAVRIFVAYELGDYTTDWYSNYNPVYIGQASNSSETGLGSQKSGVPTSKSIALSFTNIDTNFDYLKIAFASYENGTEQIFEIPKLAITGSTLSFNLKGSETKTQLSNEEVLTQTGKFTRINTLTSFNKKLWLGGVQEQQVLDYQQYANNIVVKWTSKVVDYTSIDPAVSVNDYNSTEGSFMEDEVYAFFIRFRMTKGGKSLAFHIPGRAIVSGEDDASTIAATESITAKKYQVEDTCSTDGTMSYWENENENYPTTGNFPSGKIRHHKFPSLNYLLQNLATIHPAESVADIKRTKDIKLGINISNVEIPTELEGIVDGYEILYCKRDYANATNLGQDNLLYLNNFQMGGNFTSNGNVSGTTTVAGDTMDENKVRCGIIDLLIDKPSLSELYIRNHYDIEYIDFFQTLATAGGMIGNHSQKAGASFTINGKPATFIFIDGSSSVHTKTVQITASKYLRKATFKGYVPLNSPDIYDAEYDLNDLSKINFNEFLLYLELNNGSTIAPAAYNDYTIYEGNTDTNDFEPSLWYSLKQNIKDIYTNFYNRELVSTGYVKIGLSTISIAANNLSNVYGGDIYTGYHTKVTIGSQVHADEYAVFFRRLLTASKYDITKRYADLTNFNSVFFEDFGSNGILNPVIAIASFFDFGKNVDYLIDIESQVKNDFTPAIIFDPFTEFETNFPFRVQSSTIDTIKNDSTNWYKFLLSDFYDIDNTKGIITNLQGYDDILLIHTERTLFATKPLSRLKLDATTAIIGIGQIFEFEPDEILTSKNGYAGTVHRLACKLTPVGYFFVSAELSKIFLFNGKLEEISSHSARDYFLKHLICKETSSQLIFDYQVAGTITNNESTSIVRVPITVDKIDILPSTIQEYTYLGYALDYPYYNIYVSEVIDDCDVTVTFDALQRTDTIELEDNPFAGRGYTVGFDLKYNRFIVSKINRRQEFTEIDCPALPFCDEAVSSGGFGITEIDYTAQQGYNWFIVEFNPLSVPDKLELLINGVLAATTGEDAGGNYGDPVLGFDPDSGKVYNDPSYANYNNTLPTILWPSPNPDTYVNGDAVGSRDGTPDGTVWYIGTAKAGLPTRETEFTAETGIVLGTPVPAGDQIVWCPVSPGDVVTVRVSGPRGTGWDYKVICPPLDDTRVCYEPSGFSYYVDSIKTVLDLNNPNLLNKLDEGDVVIVNNEYKKVSYDPNIAATDKVVFFNSDTECGELVLPSYPFTLNTSKSGLMYIDYTGTGTNFYIDWSNNAEIIATTALINNQFPDTTAKDVKFYHNTQNDIFTFSSPNSEINGVVNLTNLKSLTALDLSDNNIDNVIIGDCINQDDNVDLDFQTNSISETDLLNMLNSFTPVNQPTTRIIRVAGQGYTVVDDGSTGTDILLKVIDLLDNFNIQVLGDFDFGNYDFEYNFEYD